MDNQQDDKIDDSPEVNTDIGTEVDAEANVAAAVEQGEVQVAELVAEPVAELPKYEDPNAAYQVAEEAPKTSSNDNYNYNTSTEPRYNTNYNTTVDDGPMTMGDWLLTILVMALLPCVGIPMYFVWAFGKNGNINRRNYCRAYLIVMGISIIIGIIFCIVIGIGAISSLGSLYY